MYLISLSRFYIRKILHLLGFTVEVFSIEMIMLQSSNWITLLLPCTSFPLVLCCDHFNHGSRQVKRDPIDPVTMDYDATL